MEAVSLATAEVKQKITSLLGKQSSHLFVCFCRVLYAGKGGSLRMDWTILNRHVAGR